MWTVAKASWVKTYIGFGSNVGDRVATVQQALFRLRRTEGFRVRKVSSFYETEPVGITTQGLFLNGVIEGETFLSPRALLTILERFEREIGRIRRERWGPREIDLDLLFYGDLILEEPSLVIPHPRLHERDFVLIPLAELCPTLIHPKLKKSVVELLTESVIFHASHPKPYPVEVAGETV